MMKKITLSLMLCIFLTTGVFATTEEFNLRKNIIYFPTANQYFMTHADEDGFVSGKFSLNEVMNDKEEFGTMYNTLFPKEQCDGYQGDCGINVKKLLFKAVLDSKYYESPDYDDEIEIAKTRYDDSSILNSDLQEIEEKVNVLIANKDSFENSWYENENKRENKGSKICQSYITNGIIRYVYKRGSYDNIQIIPENKTYALILPLGIDTGYYSDQSSRSNFNGKDNVKKIVYLDDLNLISHISVLQKVGVEKIDNEKVFVDIDHLKYEQELFTKLSKEFETYEDKPLNVFNVKILLFYENEESELKFIGAIEKDFSNTDNISFASNCKKNYTIKSNESFSDNYSDKNYMGSVNPIIATKNNKLFVKKIDTIFDKLDKKYDYWNLNSQNNKKDYYLILSKFSDQLDEISLKFDKRIDNYSDKNFDYVISNQTKIEKAFEKKMFIDYLIKKVKFRIEEGLVEYYDYK